MTRRLILLMLLVLWPSLASAATRYVSTTGSDANSCAASTNATTPKRNFNGGSGAIACMASADILIARGGTYAETLEPGNGIPSGGGSWATATKIQAYIGETVWLKPTSVTGFVTIVSLADTQSYIEFDGINLDGTLVEASFVVIYDGDTIGGVVQRAHHIRYKNAEFKGAPVGSGLTSSHGVLERVACPGCTGGNEFQHLVVHGIGPDFLYHGMYLEAPNVLVENCEFYDITGAGVQLQYTASNATIRNNKFHSPRDGGTAHWGIVISTNSYGTIYNNIFYDLRNGAGFAYGIHNYAGGGGTTEIYNNTCYDSDGYCYLLASGANNFRNNIAFQAAINYSDSTGGTKSNNITDGTNPGFVDAPAHDFHLSMASVAIDTGADLSSVFTTDFDGVTRTLPFDKGAFEFAIACSIPGAPGSFSPTNGATGVALTPTLSWSASGATAYDVRLGTFTGVGPASFSDNFNRADNADLGVSFNNGFTGQSNAQIVSNRVRAGSTALDSVERVTTTLTADQWVAFTIPTIQGAGLIAMRAMLRLATEPTFSGYSVGALRGLGTATTWIARVDSGAETILASENATTWAPGDTLLVKIEGSTISLFRNGSGSSLIQATDLTYTSGSAGLMLYASTLSDGELDDLSVGSIGPLFLQSQASTTFGPVTLPGSTLHYWQIIAKNSCGNTSGSVNTFTTQADALPPIGPGGIRPRLR